jgi:beta-glucosidase
MYSPGLRLLIFKKRTSMVPIQSIIKHMTLEEKASLCSGRNAWSTKAIERLGIPSIIVADGPHGLRKQPGEGDLSAINQSLPATCFPPACTTASSWDPALLEQIGSALGEECLQEQVSVLLGPGVNIKRNPLCGRNFEYFSEDPLLAGELVQAFITGVQSQGVGTSLKHFAVNNQETERMTIDTIVDERALRVIYLPAFEKAVT